MTVVNEEYISIEWRSEDSSSEDEAPAPPSESSSQLGAEHSPSTTPSFDPTLVESGSTLRAQRSSQSSASRKPPSPFQSNPELPQDNFSPRGYQLELFQRACEKNIIAFVVTGSGKTLVAAMLVQKTLEDLRAAETAEISNESSQPAPISSDSSTDVEMTSDEASASESPNEQLPQKRPRDGPGDRLMVFTPKPLPRKARKVVVFLVHRVPLVPQQAKELRRVLSSEDQVGSYYGEQGVDDWSSSKWARNLRTKSVLVMTAQIFLNLLRHGLIDICDVALLIIDEVHHATKSHPYRRIFVEFYHTIKDGDPRPRVFGMTATPVKKKASYYDQTPYLTALAELEATLDATVVSVSKKGQMEVENLVPIPEEFVVTYKSQENDSVAEEYGEEDVERENDLLSRLAEHCARTSEDQQASFENDVTMTDVLPSPEMEHERATSQLQAGSDKDVNMNDSLEPDVMDLVRMICRKLGYKAAVDLITQLCRIAEKSPDIALQTLLEGCSAEEVQNNSITEHVSKLLDILCSEYLRTRTEQEASDDSTRGKEQFHCIVFVQERLSALSLTWLINSVFAPLDCNELVARSVVGAQNSDSVVRMSRANLNKTIDDFREGKYGILVSTSVVEEGLDIPACSLVVAFDPVVSPTSYIQARGRARKKGARYVAFVQQGIAASYEGLCHVRKGAKMMTEVAKCVRTEVNRRMEEMKNLKGVVGKDKMLFSRTTGARVSATEALNLLHRYCYMKGGNMDWDTYKPTYSFSTCDGGHIATVTLHSSFPVDCGLSGEPQETELLAKRHAALDAYTKLYQIGEVDAYLLPRRNSRSQRVLRMTKKCHDVSIRAFTHRSKQRSKREVASKASKKSRRVRVCKVAHPKILQSTKAEEGSIDVKSIGEHTENELLYLYQVSLNCEMHGHEWYPSRKDEVFGILVRALMPDEDQEVIRCPQGDTLFTLSFVQEIYLDSHLESIAYKYVRFLQLCLRGRSPGSEAAMDLEKKEYDNSGKAGFFLVPLLRDSSSSKLDIDWGHMQRLLTFGWRCGPVEEHESDENKVLEHVMLCSYHENLDRVYLSGSKRPDLTADLHPRGFLNSMYKSFNHYYQKKHGITLNDPQQILLEGFSVREAICSLSVSAFMLPQETCRVIPVSPLACFITSILPMWQTFLALRTCWRRNSVAESRVDFLTFARALQPNINNVAKEADLSYERLEFLGDAVLKVIYSMVTFVRNPDDSEGLLSDERDLEVSNQRLADLALEMQLQNCVAFSGVSQKVRSWPWYWATHQNESIRISEKVLADCVEALIGAQYLHGGIDLATMFMDKHNLLPGASKILGIRLGRETEGGAGGGVSVGLPPMGPGDRRHESAALIDVERKIGYKFGDKRHLVVALTHGSFENGLVSSYQRYEYLGDAIIGFLLLSYYFKKYPDLSPGELTSLRGPALSNDLFARVVVSCRLHETFWHNCSPLQKEINKFAELFANEESDDEDVSKTITVPKVLGDLLESIIGAIVVDKGMRLDGVQEIVLRVMHEELSRFANPDKFKQNPVSQVVRLIQQTCSTRPTYDYLESADNLEKTCIISANEKEFGRGVGPTRRVAKRKASIKALDYLRSEFSNMDGCASSNLLRLGTSNTLSLANKT